MVAAVLAAGACCAIVWSLALGVADVAASARVDLLAPSGPFSEQRPIELEDAARRTALAGRLNPLSPTYAADEALLAERLALAATGAAKAVLEARARAGLREAVALRPSWSHGWVWLAGAQPPGAPRTGGMLELAARLAPWDPIVQLRVATLGMGRWKALGAAARAVVRTSVERALAHDWEVASLFRAARTFGWIAEMDDLVTKPRQRAAWREIRRGGGS